MSGDNTIGSDHGIRQGDWISSRSEDRLLRSLSRPRVYGPRVEYGHGSHGNGNGVWTREDRKSRGDREALKGLATFGLSLRDKGFALGVAGTVRGAHCGAELLEKGAR